MGGECNYLLRVTPDDKRLEFVPDEEWQLPVMRAWEEKGGLVYGLAACSRVFDSCELCVLFSSRILEICSRKPRRSWLKGQRG